ncbi:hypothetical protein E2L08_06485 [Palleronia sediminis]|uniref:Uncharacterized protein n=1 Tax=Palleronia sediminis TaxID=2547833 RepID=A0A4R6AIU9_9RHOB|nr:hypothetical protein [Palleronia sediminis]TDL81313.1 hypothetical protein E2L08_06485 [Palleronia sediminis]
MSALGEILSDPRLWQAVIAGAFVAAGWIVNGAQNRRAADRLRRERLRDVHRALYAEIKHNLANLDSAAALTEFATPVLQRIVEDDFVPFVPRERNDAVFRTVLPEIHVLPRVTIDPVIRYYSQLAAHDALVEDMRGDSFKVMEAERRAAIYADLIAIKIALVSYGEEATDVIAAYAEGGKPAARAAQRGRDQ